MTVAQLLVQLEAFDPSLNVTIGDFAAGDVLNAELISTTGAGGVPEQNVQLNYGVIPSLDE